MPYLISDFSTVPGTQIPRIVSIEPELPIGPDLQMMLTDGRMYWENYGEHTPIDPEMQKRLPKEVRIEKPRGRMTAPPDMFDLGRYFVVSPKMKAKLEELEPGRHDFFAVNFSRDNGKEDYGDYYILYLHQRPDVIDLDNTLFNLRNPETGGKAAQKAGNLIPLPVPGRVHGNFLVMFKPGALEGLHLWRGTVGPDWQIVRDAPKSPNGKIYKDALARHVFVSDELAAFMKAEKITGVRPRKIVEKTPSWYFEQNR